MKLTKSFIQGIMNKGLDERLIPDGQYRDALNIEVSASEGAGVGALENIKGNTNVSNQTFTADAKTIGAIADSANSEIYWFVADTDYDYVIKYNESTSVTTILLKDTKGTVLKFDKRYLITGVNIIDNLLFWTDDLNPPRRLNIDKVYPNSGAPNFITTFIEDDISVIVRPPLLCPTITLQNSTISFQENNLKYKFLQFACRYKYENDEYSPICPFSATAFKPSSFTYVIGDDSFSSMTNARNEVKVDYYINGSNPGTGWVPDERIKEVQLLFRDTASSNINVIESFNINDITIDANGRFSNTFNNSKIYTVLPPDEITRLFDNVPLKAKAQELIGSRIAYGNYVHFYDITDSSGAEIEIDYELEMVPTDITSSPLPTFRSDRDYEIGLVYMDDYNRMTTVLVCENNTININPSNSETSNDIQVKINSEAPSFAKRYRVFVKQSKGDYYNIFVLYYYKDGVYTWFQIDRSEVDKVPLGEYVILKTNAGEASKSNQQYKVLDLQSQPKDFLNNGESQEEGLYFKLKVTDTSLFDGSDLLQYGPHISQGRNNINSSFPKTVSYILDLPNSGGVYVYNIPIFYGISSSLLHNSIIPGADSTLSIPSKDWRLKIVITGFNTTTNKNRYRVDFLDVDENGGGYSILQAEKDLPNSFVTETISSGGVDVYKFKFQSQSGFNIGDYWIVNIHSDEKDNLAGMSTNFLTYAWPQTAASPRYPNHYAIPQGPQFNINQTTGNTYTSTTQPTSLSTQDRPILAGARIKININDNSKLDHTNIFNNVDKDILSENEFISPRDYVNIEEWFWESGAFRDFKHTGHTVDSATTTTPTATLTGNTFNDEAVFSASRVFFRRGFGREGVQVGGCDVTNRIAQKTFTGSSPDATAPGGLSWEEYLRTKQTFMIIKGSGTSRINTNGNCNNASFIKVSLEVIQQEQANVFETVATESDVDIYHEFSDTFDIVNGAHQGNTANGNQVLGAQPAVVSLNPPTAPHVNTNYNAYCFGNGVEGSRIRGGFNEPILKYSPRVSSVIEEYQQQRVEEAITYSGIYRENTGINNLNEFNLSLANFKYLDKFFGSIQKLHARDTDLVAFQEEKVSKILFGKNLLSDAVGGGAVASIPEVLGTQITYAGEYGISTEPESFATWGNDMYFTDSRHGSVMRLGANGMFEISSQGMRNYFKGLFQGDATQKIGAIDPFKERYVLSSNDVLSVPCSFDFRPLNGKDFNIGNSAQSVQVSVTATASWTVALQDTGDGTSWLTINGAAAPYSGHGNEIITFNYAANSGPSNRSLQINFTGCSVSYPQTTTQYKAPKVERIIVTIGNPVDSGLILDEKYDFTSNATGGDIVFNDVTLTDTGAALTTSYTDYEGRQSIPTAGDTVEIKAIEAGTLTQKPFSPNLGNSLRYLVTSVADLEKEIDTLIGASTAVVPVLGGGEYVSSFTYARPSEEKYLYLIYDFRNNITFGSSLTGSAAITGTVNSFIDYQTRRGNVSIVCTPSGTNRFILKFNNEIIADSGNTAVPVTLTFLKLSASPSQVELSVEGGGAWNVATSAPTLTSFSIDTTDDTLTSVCASTASPDTRYHSGAAALPVEGDIIYNELTGSTVYDGNTAFHRIGTAPTTSYAVISDEGLVLSTGSCTSCSEVAVPVITQPAITLTQGDNIDLKIPTTNNAEEWAVVTTCLNYELAGGADGALFTITNCTTGATDSITVPANSFVNVCSSAAPTLISGTGTSTTGSTCDDEVLPPGISLDKLNGIFTGTAQLSGIYTFNITATNCFGTSINTAITITVNPPTVKKRFNIDVSNPKSTSGLACGVTPSYAERYHDGAKDYPEINDFVFEYCDCNLRPFNGGYLWYITDELTGVKNNVIRIDSVGQVVDKAVCP